MNPTPLQLLKPMRRAEVRRTLSAMVEQGRKQQIVSGPGVQVIGSVGGARLRVRPRGGGAGAGFAPWVLNVAPDAPSNVTVRITPGTVNGVIPTSWNTTYTRSATGTEYLSLSCTTSGGLVTAIDYDWNASPRPAPNVNAGTPPTSFFVPLAILADGIAYPVCQYRNFTATVTEVYRAAKVAPTAGEFPLEMYYTWALTQPA